MSISFSGFLSFSACSAIVTIVFTASRGYLPEAVVNYLALLGWSSEDNEEIFSLDDLIKKFDPSRISKSPSTYDVKKLQWVNAHYIKNLSLDELVIELSDKLMQPNTTHTYEIQAMNVNGTIIWSQELTVTSLRELTEEEIYQNDMANIAFKTMIDNLLAALGQ